MTKDNLHKRIRTKVRSGLQHGFTEELDPAVRSSKPEPNRYERQLREKKYKKIAREKRKAKIPHLSGNRVKKWELVD